MNDEHLPGACSQSVLASKPGVRSARREMFMALKAAAIILSVVAAILIFHG
jgi:hypothetical protein